MTRYFSIIMLLTSCTAWGAVQAKFSACSEAVYHSFLDNRDFVFAKDFQYCEPYHQEAIKIRKTLNLASKHNVIKETEILLQDLLANKPSANTIKQANRIIKKAEVLVKKLNYSTKELLDQAANVFRLYRMENSEQYLTLVQKYHRMLFYEALIHELKFLQLKQHQLIADAKSSIKTLKQALPKLQASINTGKPLPTLEIIREPVKEVADVNVPADIVEDIGHIKLVAKNKGWSREDFLQKEFSTLKTDISGALTETTNSSNEKTKAETNEDTIEVNTNTTPKIPSDAPAPIGF